MALVFRKWCFSIVLLLFWSITTLAKDVNLGLRAWPKDQVATAFIQAAIDSVHKSGGGTVWLGAQLYTTGSLELKSHVGLHLPAGCTLRGSTQLAHYPERTSFRATEGATRQLIFAQDAQNIAISGAGTLDGAGHEEVFKYKKGAPNQRPFIIHFYNCQQVRISGITLTRPAFWTQHYEFCKNVVIDGIKVYSFANRNNDGIDLNNCQDVRVSNCIIDADDDAICLKSTTAGKCENITITNCVLASNCNVIKTGTASVGTFRHITVSNCVIRPAAEESHIWVRKYALTGIALEVVDGGLMEYVNVNNITMEGVMTPIFIRLGNRGDRGDGTVNQNQLGSMRHLQLSNIQAAPIRFISSCIAGLPEALIENITLTNVNLITPGGGTYAMFRREVPENPTGYPENKMFGPSMPASCLYVRHVKGLVIHNLHEQIQKSDSRPSVFLHDVHDAHLQQLSLAGNDSTGVVACQQVMRLSVQGLHTTKKPLSWLSLIGAANEDILVSPLPYHKGVKTATVLDGGQYKALVKP